MRRTAISSRRAAALSAVVGAVLAAACTNAPPPPTPEQLTVGTVQHEIKVGMDQAAVSEALGAPNRVSTDSLRREVWTYDKIASDRVDTDSSVGGGLVVFSGARSSLATAPANQRTLTLVIYYDDEKKVRDIAYNYSSAE
jgi:outer membrane protein assembly factor BamE (lipoprotein component of BamABCDE complex)